MSKPIWDKGKPVNEMIQRYTIGRDNELDVCLAKYDILGNMAHIRMLESIGLLTKEEHKKAHTYLKVLLKTAEEGNFIIEEDCEDVHSKVERFLQDLGKKVHCGRSRNDQVLLDLKLFTRDQLRHIVGAVKSLFDILIRQSEKYKNVLLPGYTHLQVAMPSSFGLWFGAYAEALSEDMMFLRTAFDQVNRNPLGSAAGYGSSFPLNRQMTTDLLAFESMNYNSVYAQMTRGKMERNVTYAFATVAATLSKLSYDACLFNSQNFGFIKLPDDCTTGSSIMPHKKNPDVFELTRAKCNRLQNLPQEITMVINNLPSGYFRDMQLTKEIFIPAFKELYDCINMVSYMLENITVREDILSDPRYDNIFSVEEVNRMTLSGVPFRDAYRKVAASIEEGSFKPDRTLNHTHMGSMGNLCNDKIVARMEELVNSFPFETIDKAMESLVYYDLCENLS